MLKPYKFTASFTAVAHTEHDARETIVLELRRIANVIEEGSTSAESGNMGHADMGGWELHDPDEPTQPAATLDVKHGVDDYDELYDEAVKATQDAGRVSTSLIQRHLRIGYNRALHLVEQMEKRGVVGPEIGSAPRELLIPRR